MISGWSDWRATFEEESAKKWWLDNIIFFKKNNIQNIQTVHDDDVVISTMIANYDIKKIVDNESLTDILFYSTFSWMRLPTDRLRRISKPLVNFTRDEVTVKGKITLSLIVRIYR